jgi:hypothetical protein
MVAAEGAAPGTRKPASSGTSGTAAVPADDPTGQVLGASTGAMGVGSAATMDDGRAAVSVAHAGAASSLGQALQLDKGKLALVVTWLALNGAGIIVYRRKRNVTFRTGDFLPISLGAFTYRSGTGVGA